MVWAAKRGPAAAQDPAEGWPEVDPREDRGGRGRPDVVVCIPALTYSDVLLRNMLVHNTGGVVDGVVDEVEESWGAVEPGAHGDGDDGAAVVASHGAVVAVLLPQVEAAAARGAVAAQVAAVAQRQEALKVS